MFSALETEIPDEPVSLVAYYFILRRRPYIMSDRHATDRALQHAWERLRTQLRKVGQCRFEPGLTVRCMA